MMLALLPLGMMAQDFIGGKVVGQKPSYPSQTEPLVGAAIYWSKTRLGTVTDVNGEYRLQVAPNSDTLVVSYVGYKSEIFKHTGESTVDVKLILGEELGAADIEAERHSTEMSLINPLNVQTLDEKELCKAACCNLSESFETNAAVDASFTDAVTGTRQIRMLGLDGKYTQIMKDNIPLVRGLSTIYGLNYVPGAWINSIQISKGVGSVVNGYESITGQINVEHKNPDNAEKMYINVFYNRAGRIELNANFKQKINEKLSTTLLTHGEFLDRRWDMNNDGFIDAPLKKDVIVRNEWTLHSGSLNGTYQFTYLIQEKLAGQMNFQPIQEALSPDWGMHLVAERMEAAAKTGYVLNEEKARSFGSQFSYSQYTIDSEFGDKEYDGFQRSFRANVLFGTDLGSEEHKLMTGVSYVYDEFDETFDHLDYDRVEKVPGVFAEYTWVRPERFTVVAGMRADEHNLFGTLLSPRFHARYSITEQTSVKVGGGIGYRTPNVVMENVGLLASARTWVIRGNANQANFGLPMESAMNLGVNVLQKFRLFYRDASISADFYRTNFTDQLIIDLDQDAQQVNVYALEGESFSNSAQVELQFSPARRFEVRTAYRWLDVQSQYDQGMLTKAMVSNHRAFSNFAYETKMTDTDSQWKFDATVQWIGEARIPDTSTNPEQYRAQAMSDDFVMFNAQVTRVFNKGFEIYLGGENLANFRQSRPIISADQPFGEHFDASLVWGPIFGRMFYGGLRWKIFDK